MTSAASPPAPAIVGEAELVARQRTGQVIELRARRRAHGGDAERPRIGLHLDRAVGRRQPGMLQQAIAVLRGRRRAGHVGGQQRGARRQYFGWQISQQHALSSFGIALRSATLSAVAERSPDNTMLP